MLDQHGVTEAVEWGYKDSHRLRHKIYSSLSQIDPYFDLNEPEFNALLCNTEYGLDSVLAEIYEILELGKVSGVVSGVVMRTDRAKRAGG
jgi:hypothetical protein